MYGSHQLYECVCAETNSPAALLSVQPAAGRHLKSGRLQPGVCPHDGLFIWGILLFSGQVFLFVVCTYMNTCIYVYIHRGLQHTCIIGHMYFYWPSLTIWISHLSQLKTNSNFNSENKSLTLEVKFLFRSALSTVECTRTHTHTCARVRACVWWLQAREVFTNLLGISAHWHSEMTICRKSPDKVRRVLAGSHVLPAAQTLRFGPSPAGASTACARVSVPHGLWKELMCSVKLAGCCWRVCVQITRLVFWESLNTVKKNMKTPNLVKISSSGLACYH